MGLKALDLATDRTRRHTKLFRGAADTLPAAGSFKGSKWI